MIPVLNFDDLENKDLMEAIRHEISTNGTLRQVFVENKLHRCFGGFNEHFIGDFEEFKNSFMTMEAFDKAAKY